LLANDTPTQPLVMKMTLSQIYIGIPPATQLYGTRSKVVTVHAMMAYRGAEV